MVNYYATEAELEGFTSKTFSATSPVTSTNATNMLTYVSAQLDGLCGQDSSGYYFGTDSTCPYWCKSAVLSACAYKIYRIYQGKEPDEREVIKILKSYIVNRDSDLRPVFATHTPNSVGEWET
jgi:hypothetical protein